MPSLTDEIATIRSLASSGHSPTEIAASIGREIGDVQTVLASVTLPAADSPGSTPSTPALKHIVFPFAFDTPGLNNGVVAYVPTIGDLLLEAYFEIDTAWDGVTPLADIGTLTGGTTGLFLWAYAAVPLDSVADAADTGAGMALAFTPTLRDAFFMSAVSLCTTPAVNPGSIVPPAVPVSPNGNGIVRFTSAANPLKVVVSQDGTAGGVDPAATKGAAQLHLLVLPAP